MAFFKESLRRHLTDSRVLYQFPDCFDDLKSALVVSNSLACVHRSGRPLQNMRLPILSSVVRITVLNPESKVPNFLFLSLAIHIRLAKRYLLDIVFLSTMLLVLARVVLCVLCVLCVWWSISASASRCSGASSLSTVKSVMHIFGACAHHVERLAPGVLTRGTQGCATCVCETLSCCRSSDVP